MSVGYAGAVVGPLITGHILDVTGSFKMIFLVLVAVSIATIVIAFSIKETGREFRRR
jgi:CP family cyanate transporter-like MFS transporter